MGQNAEIGRARERERAGKKSIGFVEFGGNEYKCGNFKLMVSKKN